MSNKNNRKKKRNIMDKYTFSLNNFVLYSKGWYRSVESEIDAFQMYKRILELDDHSYVTCMHDVIQILMTEFTSFNDFCKEHKRFHFTILTFFNRVNDLMTFYKLDFQTAMVEVIRSFFRDAEGKYINLKPPHYNRKLYKKGIMFSSLFSFKKKGQTYKEQNKIAKETFK